MTATPKTYISLDQAAALIPGATADTLKRLHRAGKLTVYRVGKKYCTTLADLETAIERSKIAPRERAETDPLRDLSSTERSNVARDAARQIFKELKQPSVEQLASAALDSAVAGLRKRKRPKR